MQYVTRGLLEVLLELARDAEPESVTAGLSVTRSAAFDPGLGLDPATPVFTHFYMPEAGESLNAVFGMDMATPPGQTQGRFISHPDGDLSVSREDHLHEVVLVAVPPWDVDAVRAFGRDGAGRELTILDAAPPTEALD